MNAIMNKNEANLSGATLYVTLFPCNECAKLIIQSGIRQVIFLSDKYHHSEAAKASRRLFDMAGVEYVQLIPISKRLVIDFSQVAESVTRV
jgi:dCMP deaminase